MSKKRILASLVLPLLLASFLQSQSVAELAKKEKERRAALKGKATTVTAAEIAKVKKKPSVEATEAQAETEEEARAAEAAPPAQQEAAPPPAGQPPAAAAPEKAAGKETPPVDEAAKSAAELQKRQKELADKAQEKIELVELLNLKLNALYQEFQGLENIKSRETMQLQISDTYDKLLKAETESAKAQKELEDFLAEVSKKKTPAIWIR
jgi:hypothetical protein